MTQNVNEFTVMILSADEIGGFPMVGKNDAGIAKVFDKDGNLIDEAWMTVSKNGKLRFERVH